MKPKAEDLAKVIEENIEYMPNSDNLCPHCKKKIRFGPLSCYWIYTGSELCLAIIEFLGLAIFDIVTSILEDFNGELSGNKGKDSIIIAKVIIDKVYL